LAIGSPGQLLGINGAGQLAWATLSLGIGIGSPIASSSAFGVFYASPAGALAQDVGFTWNPGSGLGIGLIAGRPLQIGGALQPQLWLDAATAALATQTRAVAWSTANQPRWSLQSPPATEPGSNVGSDLAFASYLDDGTKSWAMTFFRANNHVSIGSSADGSAQLFIQNGAPAQTALVVRGAASQSQALQQWQ
jgi:hypothetical protein